MGKKKAKVEARVIKARDTQIKKAETITQVSEEQAYNAGDWIEPPSDLRGYKNLESESSILPQCVRAYKNNIAGFGIGIRYIEEQDETPEMEAEYDRAKEIIELLTIERDTKEVFEDVIEAREIYGISYIEVIRDLYGEVQQIEFIRDTPSVRKTRPLYPYIDTVYYHHGKETVRKKKFRKYRQQIGGKIVYFKEFGDTRIMDRRNGEYLEEGRTLERQYQANEILEFSLGSEPYGEVRWIGQILGVDGSRRAEGLNNNYFRNGRHTPLMIIVKGGTLTEQSFDKLQSYMDDIKGENGQHAFMVLEAENLDGRADFDDAQKPEIEVKDLAAILQKDELFQEYLENNRRRVQSAFQLPDLYVGYTTDFNRATSQTAQEVTEEQVFQPERKSLAWVINNKLLNCYCFKYVEAYFLEPDITNPDDLYKLLTVANNAGGLTPSKAKQIVCEALGETSEDYEEEWGDIPIAVSKSRQQAGVPSNVAVEKLAAQIQKAQSNHEPDEVVAVMKEVRKLLTKMQKQEGKE